MTTTDNKNKKVQETGNELSAKVEEQGQGFPEVGEYVHEVQENEIYKVISIDSGILTGDPGYGKPNYIYATLGYLGDPCDISEEEYDAIRNLRITIERSSEQEQ